MTKREYEPGEYSINFYNMTGIDGYWDGVNEKFTFDPSKTKGLDETTNLNYAETLTLWYITFIGRSGSSKMAFWTDSRHKKDATWGEGKQLEAAKQDWICEQIADRVRENIEQILGIDGEAAVCSIEGNEDDSEIFDKVVEGKGSPDIFEFKLDSTGPEIAFIEVKGPHEAELRETQKDWFEAMNGIFPGYKASLTSAEL